MGEPLSNHSVYINLSVIALGGVLLWVYGPRLMNRFKTMLRLVKDANVATEVASNGAGGTSPPAQNWPPAQPYLPIDLPAHIASPPPRQPTLEMLLRFYRDVPAVYAEGVAAGREEEVAWMQESGLLNAANNLANNPHGHHANV